MDKKEIEKKYMEYQLFDKKIKEMQEQISLMDQQLIEVMASLQSLDEYAKTEDKSEILVPLQNGIFAKAQLKKEDKLLVNVGSSLIVDKTIDGAKALIEKQKGQIEEARETFAQNIQILGQRLAALEKELSQV